MVQEWSKDVPAAWETMLRAFSPHSRVVPWLAIRWFPARRVLGCVPTDCGRWLLSECVPVDTLSEIDRSIVAYFEGPKPSTMPESRYRVVKTFCNDYQWEMYRTHRVWARELWIVQGNAGGHATQFAPEEQQLLQAKGLPTDPPALGALPYAPVDQRVLAAMHRRNRLVQFGNNLARWKASGDPGVMASEYAASQTKFRTEYLAFLEDQTRELAALNVFATRKSEDRGALREATRAEVSAASRLDEYLETGLVPR